MKLNDYKETYEELSGIASDIVRKLAFVGIAIVWIYKLGEGGSYQVPADLHWPTILLVLCLLADLLQYVIPTLIYYWYFRHNERKGIDTDTEFNGPAWFTWPGWSLWSIKLILIIWAYVLLLLYLWNQLGFSTGSVSE